jgi:biopolymer transport protein TolR
MSMGGGGGQGVRSEINITPLVDVVLVLLIIFMVLTPSMLKHLDPTIPKKADENVIPSAETPIIIEYTAKQILTINGEPVRPEQLAESLAGRLRVDRQKVVFFKAEDEAPYGEVIRLMDIARGSGAKTLAVVTTD